MLGGDVNHYPILLLVNYWEIRPSRLGPRLDELLKRGISQFATFIPWQAAESDITHTLIRFLQAVADRRMQVQLILSPEVGIHYPNSGLPKDLISRKENLAQHCQTGPINVNLPPNSFQLPSLFAPDFTKRYYSFLTRMDGIFADLAKNQPSLIRGVTAVVTGSFWKYYRSPLLSNQSAFGGNAGDYSSHAAMAYRQRVEQFFAQREFSDPTPAAANRWKTRAVDDINRRWFYQQSEDVFRSRSFQMIKKKALDLKVSEFELFTPEADPSLTYLNYLQMISGGHADFPKLSSLLDEVAARKSLACANSASSWVHWTSMGGFRMLSEAEKQFLLLKSLLLTGGQGGGILIDESEWFSLSHHFRNRVDAIARALLEKRFHLETQALYLVPHLWSSYGTLWEEMVQRVGPGVTMVSSIELILKESFCKLLVVDPSVILTREVVQKLIAWSKAGRVVVLPKSQLYTDMAKNELEQSLVKSKKIEIDLGFTYQLHALGDGKLIVYDLPDSWTTKGEPLSSWQVFLNAILSIAEIDSYCKLSDHRLKVIPLELGGDRVATFVLNGTKRPVTADIIFSKDVQITDLGSTLVNDGKRDEDGEAVSPGSRFTLDVPPFGILPLLVDGLNLSEARERQMAAMNSKITHENAMNAAIAELSGLGTQEEGLEELWS